MCVFCVTFHFVPSVWSISLFVRVSRLVLCVFVCSCVCTLPALLLNNPAYHLLLSDHRKGSRPRVVPSTAQAQEKSLNVPQGKRPQTGPTQSGEAPPSLSSLSRVWGISAALSAEMWWVYFACVWPSSSLLLLTLLVTLIHSPLNMTHALCEGTVWYGEIVQFFSPDWKMQVNLLICGSIDAHVFLYVPRFLLDWGILTVWWADAKFCKAIIISQSTLVIHDSDF